MAERAGDEALLSPLRRMALVPAPPAVVFEWFTERLVEWWPLATHSVGQADATHLVLESGLGGRVYERVRDGTVHLWGTITVWEPPRGFAMTWHPGRSADTAQDLEVRFVAVDEGTRVELTQTGWERLGEEAGPTREVYEGGWATVFERLREKVAGRLSP